MHMALRMQRELLLANMVRRGHASERKERREKPRSLLSHRPLQVRTGRRSVEGRLEKLQASLQTASRRRQTTSRTPYACALTNVSLHNGVK